MSSLAKDVVVLCWIAPAQADRCAHKIARFLGVEPAFVSLSPADFGDGRSIRAPLPRCTCLIVDAETLANAADVMSTGVSGLSSLTSDAAAHVFIYGFRPTDRHRAVLRHLSSSSLLDVRPQPGAAPFHVADDHREWCGPFSGLSLEATGPTEQCFLERPAEHTRDSMIRIGDEPFFVRRPDGGSQLYFSASSELADLDEKVLEQHPARPLSWFSRLIPMMMFLRGALGDRVWHNDSPRACFIIDDPLLKRRHGFLDYDRLVEVVQRQGFSTSIAFIPWNYRRSTPGVASLFSSTPQGLLSLCVHGCDHIDAEFETTDVDSLRGRAATALERMRSHRRLSGIPFDDVMVFPRGRFSAEAVSALQASGYLATVNGDVWPANRRDTVTVRDLLEVANTRFADFPLFGRRYPRDLAEFAFDLFVGKPALAVEHHGYFRDGYEALSAFVERLQGLDPRLEWTNLSTICSTASRTRTASGGNLQVQFYTSQFWLRNNTTRTQRYTLFRRHAHDAPLPAVTVNGREYRCEREDDRVRISLSLDDGQAADIRVSSDAAACAGTPWQATNVQDAGVRARRLISEFRDNYVDTTRGRFGRLIHRSPATARVSDAPRAAARLSSLRKEPMPATLPRYVLITPARNEATFIELTIKSVIAQTALPVRWIIVSDGSTDGTDEIVQKYLADHHWMELLKLPERAQRHFAGKAIAFNAGYAKAAGLEYDVIGNLDADVSFEPDYLAFLMSKFAENPRLGVAGTPYREDKMMYDERFKSPDHVSGACQLFRRECFEAIDGYPLVKSGGIDFMALLKAQAAGWQTRRFDEKFCNHHRNVGSELHSPVYRRLLNHGRMDYLLGSHPAFEIFRIVLQMKRRPYVVGGLLMLSAYLWAMLRSVERTMPEDLIALYQRDQLRRLKAVLRHPFRHINGLNPGPGPVRSINPLG